jgi:hypothetical protein
MTEYSSLLVGGAKKVRKACSPELAASRLAALAKGRATAAANRASKMKGAGLLGSAAYQDIVDTDQQNYAGNPLDVLPGKYTAPVVEMEGGKVMRVPKGKATRHEAALIGVGQDLVVGAGKVKSKKLSKKDIECIALAEAEDGVKSVSDEGEIKGGKVKEKKIAHKDMLPEAIRRLGNLASNFQITLIKVPKNQL